MYTLKHTFQWTLISLLAFTLFVPLTKNILAASDSDPAMNVTFSPAENEFNLSVNPNTAQNEIDWVIVYHQNNGNTNGLSGNGNDNPFNATNLFAGTCSGGEEYTNCVPHSFSHLVAKSYITSLPWGKTQLYKKVENGLELVCEYTSASTELTPSEDAWVSASYATPSCAIPTVTQTPTITPTQGATATPTPTITPACPTPSERPSIITISPLCTVNVNYRLWLLHNTRSYPVQFEWQIANTQQGGTLYLEANEYYWLATLPESTNTLQLLYRRQVISKNYGALNLCPTETPTPTPTATLTPTQTPTPTTTQNNSTNDSTSSSTPSNPGPPSCNDTKPGVVTNLRIQSSSTNSVTLAWNPAKEANYYALLFTRKSDGTVFGASNIGNVTSYKINGISAGAYTFEIFAVHGCMPGDKVSLSTGVVGSVLSGRPVGENGTVLGDKSVTPTPTSNLQPGNGAGLVSGATSTCEQCRWIPALLIQFGSILVLSYVARRGRANNIELKKYIIYALLASLVTYILHILINRPCLARWIIFYYVPGMWICKFFALIQVITLTAAFTFWRTFKPEIKIRKK